MIEDIVYDKFAHLSIAGGITLGALRYANGTKHEKELMLRASVGVVIKQHSSDEDQAQYCTIDEGGYNMSAYVSKYHTYLRVTSTFICAMRKIALDFYPCLLFELAVTTESKMPKCGILCTFNCAIYLRMRALFPV